ncbi:hypothetical protein V8C37DRAFT_381464 [Trichoderma ceciliae]
MDVLGLLSNISQVVDLLVKIGVMCSIYCVDLKNAPQDVRKLLKEIDRLSLVIKDLDLLLKGPKGSKLESPALRQTIFDLRRLLAELVAKLDLGVKHARAVWPFRKRDVHGIIDAIERQKANITLSINIEQTSILLDVHQEIVLSKLRVAEAATFDSSVDGEESFCLQGTRSHIIEQIQQWSVSPNSRSVFWLNGMAGTGKSTISRTIAQSFADAGVLGASFFFKRGEGDRGRTAFLFTTIAAQLVRRIPSLAPHIRGILDTDPSIHEKPLNDQFQKLILDPLNKSPGCWPSPSLLIVIDALDECGLEESMRTLMGIFSKAQNMDNPQLKFFLTSRPELPIRLGFEEIGGKYDNLLLAAVPIPTVEHDIDLFMRHQLHTIKKDYNMSVTQHRKISSDWPGEDVVRKLVAAAIPLFIIAATMGRFLRDRRLGSPQHQLSKILQYQNTPTSGLDRTYLPVLDRLIDGLSPSSRQEVLNRFRYLIGSIITLAQPLSIGSLAHLLDVSTDVIEDQLDLLHSVLSVPSDLDTPVRLLHLSFRDFLVDSEKTHDLIKYPFWVDEEESHSRLFSQCLKLLSTGGFLKQDICSLRNPGTLRSEVDQKVIDECLPPAIQYACMYWAHHLNLSNRSICDDDQTHQFLACHLLHWLEALTLMGRILESIYITDSLWRNLEHNNGRSISKLLKDTRRFILTNIGTFNKAPLQIYSSALIFIPENSVVRKLFEKSIPSWLSSLPRIQSHWDPCLATLENRDISIVNVRVFPTGGKFVSNSMEGILKIWDINTTSCVETHRGARFIWSRSNEFSTDGKGLLYLSGDEVLQIMDTKTNSCIAEYIGHTSHITSAMFSATGHRLASASKDGTLRIWDRITKKCLAIYDYNPDSNRLIDFSPDGTKFIMVSNEHVIHLLDTDKVGCKSIYNRDNEAVESVYFSLDSRKLVSLHDGGVMKIWDSHSDALSIADGFHSSSDNAVAFFSDNNRLVAPIKNHGLGIWDISEIRCDSLLQGHRAPVCDIKLSSDERRIASASYDKTIRIWDTSTGACITTYIGHDQAVNAIAYSPDNKFLVSLEFSGTSKVWDLSIEAHTTTPESHDGAVLEVIFSPNKQKIITTSGDRTLKLWDTMTSECMVTGKDHQSFGWIPLVIPQDIPSAPFDHTIKQRGLIAWPRSVVFSSDSSKLASATEGDTTSLKVWDTTTGSFNIILQDAQSPVRSIAFSPDGLQVVFVTRDGVARYCNTIAKDCYASCSNELSGVCSSAFSADSTQLVSACSDGVIRLSHLSTSHCEEITLIPGEAISLAAISADLTKVASISSGKLSIFDINTQTCIADYTIRCGSGISHICFSPNSQYLAAMYTGGDVKIRAWDAATGTCVYEADICGLANHMAFDSAGSNLTTNVGIVSFDPPNLTHTPDTGQKNPPHSSSHVAKQTGIGLSKDGEWVTWNSQNMLWLPPTYRVSASDICASTIALGSRLGRLLLIEIDPSVVSNLT